MVDPGRHIPGHAFFLLAYRSTQYLQALLLHGSIFPEANEALDAVFREFSSPVSVLAGEEDIAKFVLTRRAVPAITSLFDLKGNVDVDMYRAIDQAQLRIDAEHSSSR